MYHNNVEYWDEGAVQNQTNGVLMVNSENCGNYQQNYQNMANMDNSRQYNGYLNNNYGLNIVTMKVKDLERTVNVAWSPADQYPIYLAAGTAAQQLDASFSTNASLEIYSLNLSEPGMDMELKASVNSDHRFHNIVWGNYGSDPVNSVIVGGCDNGLVQMYSASKLLKNEESLISCQDKHTGPVHALDFNPFQQNLLATGASESEIFIWDLNNTTTPMTPGSKSQPLEDVQCISWNRQVQHILATTFHSRCVVWDLRKNEPIIKLTDTASHIRWKVVAWHPEVATQLCLASEEDQFPVVQMWDLRFATSPLKVLENHTRGILSIAWCNQDSDLLISCGKDNRILCWNPNSTAPRGEVLSEIAQTIQWNFDVAWCPRNPALIAASNFDGHVSVYSLMGGKQEQLQTSNKIADSFPGMDGYVQAPAPQQAPPVSVDLSKPPKWLKRPVGASFGFGGKLITFENNKPTSTQNQQPGQAPTPTVRSVDIHQVITEPELVEKSNELEQALQNGNFIEYCNQKALSSKNKHEIMVWNFIKANFAHNRKEELLNLLGYKPEEVNLNLNNHIKKAEESNHEVNQLSDQLTNLNHSENYDGTFDAIASEHKNNSYELKKPSQPFKIGTGNDIDGLIAKALLLGNIEAAVELCISSNRMADALIIAMTGSDELLARTQYKYLNQSEGYVSQLISSLVSENWSSIIDNCDISSWKEALAAALTHTNVEEQLLLCERLGERLEHENFGNTNLLQDAQLCYICAGSFNKLVASWSADVSTSSPEKLQELVELVTFMQKAIEQQGRSVEVSGNLANLMSHYASLLASQGNLNTALNYIGTSNDFKLMELRDRLYYSLGHKPQTNNRTQPQLSSRLSNPRVSIPNYPTQQSQFSPQINPYNPNQFNNQFNNTPPNPGPLSQFNTGLLKQNTVPSWQNQNSVPQTQAPPLAQPPKPFTPTPSVPPSHPPRPTSSSSAHSGSGLGRVKYVVDPSLQSNSFGMRSSFDNNMPPSNPMPNPMAPPAPSNMPPVPMMPVNTQVPTMTPGGVQNGPYQLSNCPPILPPNPLQNSGPQSPSFPTPNQFNMNPIQSQPTASTQMPGQMFNSGNIEVAQPALNPLPAPPSMNTPPGWNDPPMLSKSTRAQPKPVYTPQAPITHPLFGAGQTQEPVPMNNGYTDMPTVPPYGQAPPMQMQQQPAVYRPPSVQQIQQQESPVRSNVATPEPPKNKGPLPEEHMYLQTVFDELKNQCSCAANNPQTKRKLDDVSRKLETLYDMLRENKLSPSTTASLHQIVQMVQRGDYAGGLNLHTQLVSGPDFAQIATFMPGLKVLMQCALQLNVYLR